MTVFAQSNPHVNMNQKWYLSKKHNLKSFDHGTFVGKINYVLAYLISPMINHYIKIALRSIIRSKGFSFINIFGLATGMTACVLIMFYVIDEMSYDKHHKDGYRLYRIASEVKDEKWVAAPAPMAEALK